MVSLFLFHLYLHKPHRSMNIVVIDNYDSFVYNLVHYLEALDCNVTVLRNDSFHIDGLKGYDKIILSPGPGIPGESGLLKEVIKTYASTKSILGICLGHQAIAEVFGATLTNLEEVFHGVATKAKTLVTDEILFKDFDTDIEIGRYHSWIVSEQNFPEVLEITSKDEEGNIMSLRHKFYDVKGVQFHPESVLTPRGKMMIKNWVKN